MKKENNLIIIIILSILFNIFMGTIILNKIINIEKDIKTINHVIQNDSK